MIDKNKELFDMESSYRMWKMCWIIKFNNKNKIRKF